MEHGETAIRVKSPDTDRRHPIASPRKKATVLVERSQTGRLLDRRPTETRRGGLWAVETCSSARGR